MANKDIEIKLKAIDEASSIIDAASKKISADVNEVSNSQRELSAAVESSLPPLSASEQAQMNNASSAIQLNSAQVNLRDAQKNLNGAITEYGANSTQAAAALRDLNNAQANVSTLQAQVGVTTRQNEASMKSFATGLSGVATASFSLYGAYDRVNNAELSLDRSNLMVKSSTKAVEDAHRSVSEAILKHGASSQEAKSAEQAYEIAQDRLTLANERAKQSQEDVNKSIMSAALQVIPTSITMVDNLSKAWNNFPDLTGAFSKLKTKISDVCDGVDGLGGKLKGLNGISFGTLIGGLAAVAVAAADVKYSIDQTNYEKSVYKVEHGQNTEMPWYEQAFDYFKNFEIGVPMMASDYLMSALGVQKLSVEQQAAFNKYQKGEISEEELKKLFENVPHMADGGIIDHATFALLGEDGPEIVEPLSRYEARKTIEKQASQTTPQYPQQIIPVTINLNVYEQADYELAKEKVLDGISEAYARQRGT